jgi:putative ABC transport system permease protein
LYALALDHLSDYATLKAIGADYHHIYGIVIVQSLSIAIFGTAMGVAIVFLIKHYFDTPVAPIDVPLWVLLSGIALNFILCLMASVLPFGRIRRVDPAMAMQE